jgi:hypothetical protein
LRPRTSARTVDCICRGGGEEGRRGGHGRGEGGGEGTREMNASAQTQPSVRADGFLLARTVKSVYG